MLDIDLGWYLRRVNAETADRHEGSAGRRDSTIFVLTKVAETWVRLLAPFAPHVCEEAWEKFGGKGFISNATWPSADQRLIDIEAEEQESYLMRVLEDTRAIMKVTNIKPKTLFYYTSPRWMSEVYKLMLSAALKGEDTIIGSLIREVLSQPFAKGKEKIISRYIQNTYSATIKTMPKSLIERRLKVGFSEESTLKESMNLIRSQFSADVKVFDAEAKEIYDPTKKGALSQPYRPSIYIES